VLEVRETDALLTTSHPLAGETLHFDIEIMSLRASTEEELEHGHPHGPDGMGGHDHSHDHDDH
jgi:FKBP-type peptidyl-prolyl cis-trans isomerase SlyD